MRIKAYKSSESYGIKVFVGGEKRDGDVDDDLAGIFRGEGFGLRGALTHGSSAD